jgi:hypothetical protein
MLRNGFQRRTFPFLWVPELSPASATSFKQQQSTTTELQMFSNCDSDRSYVTTDGRSVSLFWCQALNSRFLLLSNRCGFVDVGHPLWRGDGPVIYNCCWNSPAQSFTSLTPAGLTALFYCLRIGTPSTWRTRSPYLYPPGTEWPRYTSRHWVLFSSSPIPRRAKVEVFEPASTRGC